VTCVINIHREKNWLNTAINYQLLDLHQLGGGGGEVVIGFTTFILFSK
jgi:hypothetical protein